MNHQHIVHRINFKRMIERENANIERMNKRYKPAMIVFILLALFVICKWY